MKVLLYGTSLSAILARSSSNTVLKSSGSRTPAPTSKVLRWKDLEAAAVADAAGLEQSSVQSVFGTEEGDRDLLNYDGMWENELEELSV